MFGGFSAEDETVGKPTGRRMRAARRRDFTGWGSSQSFITRDGTYGLPRAHFTDRHGMANRIRGTDWRRGWDCLRPCRFALRAGNALLARLAPAFEPGASQGFSSRPETPDPSPDVPGWGLAEGVGFEPTEPFGSPVFKTGAIDHSTTPPLGCSYVELKGLCIGKTARSSSNWQPYATGRSRSGDSNPSGANKWVLMHR